RPSSRRKPGSILTFRRDPSTEATREQWMTSASRCCKALPAFAGMTTGNTLRPPTTNYQPSTISHQQPTIPAASMNRQPTRNPPTSLILAKTAVHALALAPLALLSWKFWQVYSEADIDALGADPVAAIEHELGAWALRLLLLTLAITPL